MNYHNTNTTPAEYVRHAAFHDLIVFHLTYGTNEALAARTLAAVVEHLGLPDTAEGRGMAVQTMLEFVARNANYCP